MAELFLRDFNIQVSDVVIRSQIDIDDGTVRPVLRVTFQVEKTDERFPNTAEISIWNLNEEHRAAVQERLAPCIIKAGYLGNVSQIFSGDLRFTESSRRGTDFVSSFTIADGGKQYTSSRVDESFGPGTSPFDIITKVADALDVGSGNLAEKLREGGFPNALVFNKAVIVSGQAAEELDKFMRATGLEWSIQDGQIQALKKKDVVKDNIVILKKSSGLIGSPVLGEDGIVRGQALLQGQLFPGRQVDIESIIVEGSFKLTKVVHSGDTWGTDWVTNFEAIPL